MTASIEQKVKTAIYVGPPQAGTWHGDVRVYELDPPYTGLNAETGKCHENVEYIAVSVIKEPYIIETGAFEADEFGNVYGWLEQGCAPGVGSHTASLTLLGYTEVYSKPEKGR